MSNMQIIDELFLNFYPNGLQDEAFIALSKKHKSNNKVFKLIEEFNIENLVEEYPPVQNENIRLIIKLISGCSMISVFEKVAFKNYIADPKIHEPFLSALYKLLKNNNKTNFSNFVYVLSMKKHETNANPAKWPVVTFFLLFFNLNKEVFIKPTTIKKVALLLDYDIKYVATPNYETYSCVKKMVMDYKKQSVVCKKENNIMVQAVMYTALNI